MKHREIEGGSSAAYLDSRAAVIKAAAELGICSEARRKSYPFKTGPDAAARILAGLETLEDATREILEGVGDDDDTRRQTAQALLQYAAALTVYQFYRIEDAIKEGANPARS